jgi:hypothetical protein
MISLDLLGEVAPVRGDTYVHVFKFQDETEVGIDMWGNGQTYACEFRNRNNSLSIVGTCVQGATAYEIQLEASIPASLASSEIGAKLWSWDIERDEGGIITTIIGGDVEIKRDATNSPGPV